MIYGIGIDLVKIERMKGVVNKWGEKFLRRVFTENEITYCYEKKDPSLSLAVRFAAKEALIKAMGAKVAIALTEIEVVNHAGGKPVLQATGRLEQFIADNSIRQMHLSLSHEREYGIACVLLETD